MVTGVVSVTEPALHTGQDFLRGSGSSYQLLDSFLDEQYEECALRAGVDSLLSPRLTGLPNDFRYSSTCMPAFLQRWNNSFMGSTFSSIYPTLGGKFYECNAKNSSHDMVLAPEETGLQQPFHFSSACMKEFSALYRNVTGIMARDNITEYDAHFIKGGEKLIIWLANSRDEEYYSCEEQADLDRVLYCNVTHNTWPFYYSSTCMHQFLTRRRTEVLAYRVVSAMLTCVFALLLLVGVLGNLSLIYMYVAIAELRTSANTYVVSLAVSDVFLTTLYTPFIASLYSDYVTLWGPAYRLGKVVEEVAILASAWTLVAMSLERYLSLRHVGPPRPVTTPLRRALKILAIWLVAGAMAVPSVVRALLHSQRCYTYYAAPDDGFDALVEAWDLLVSYGLPLALTAACYCSSARLLYRSAAAIPGEQQAQQVAQRRSSARMVMSLVLLFLAFYSPQYLVNLYGLVHLAARGEALQDSSIAFGVLVDVVQFVRVVHSCITPVLLYCTVTRFRKYLQRSTRRLAATARAVLQ